MYQPEETVSTEAWREKGGLCGCSTVNQGPRLVENEAGDKGKGQVMKDLESHNEEFRSYYRSRGGF